MGPRRPITGGGVAPKQPACLPRIVQGNEHRVRTQASLLIPEDDGCVPGWPLSRTYHAPIYLIRRELAALAHDFVGELM